MALALASAFKITKGTPKIFLTQSANDTEVGRAFCGECGTPLYSIPPNPPFTPVKLGALDDASDLAPKFHVYASSAPHWHMFYDGLPWFPKMPPPMPIDA